MSDGEDRRGDRCSRAFTTRGLVVYVSVCVLAHSGKAKRESSSGRALEGSPHLGGAPPAVVIVSWEKVSVSMTTINS